MSRVGRATAVAVVMVFFAGMAGLGLHAAFHGTQTAGLDAAGQLETSVAGDDGATGADVAAQTGDTGTSDGVGSAAKSATGGGGGATSGRGAGSGSGGAAGGPLSTAVFPSTGKSGRGFTASEVQIGFQNAANLQAGFALVGANGTAPDEKAISEDLVKWVNSHGGIAGRRVVPVYADTDTTSGTWASQAQEACSAMGEDHQVVMAVSGFVGGSDALSACLASKRIPYAESNIWPFDAADYRRLADILYQPGRMNADRWARAYVDGLFAAGYFDKGGKLGLLRNDARVFNHLADDIVKPRLAQLGIKVDDEVIMSTPGGAADLGGQAGEINNAILQFRAANVDHVIFLEEAGIVPFLFMPSAEGQGYRPRYGVSSQDIPATLAGQVPAAQLNRAALVGWIPGSDTEKNPGIAGWSFCEAIFKAAGYEDVSGLYHINRCDGLLFVKAVLERSATFTPEAIRGVIDANGVGYQSAATFQTKLGAGRHDAATAFRIGAFDNGCACFVYVGGDRPAP